MATIACDHTITHRDNLIHARGRLLLTMRMMSILKCIKYLSETQEGKLIHQRWGTIHKTTPIEIKAAASLRDRQRYQALIVRGKMHLSVQGKYQPKDTLDAFAAAYEGNPSPDDLHIVDRVSSTMRDLLVLYQKGGEVESLKKLHSATTYHDKTALTKKYIELSSVPRVS